MKNALLVLSLTSLAHLGFAQEESRCCTPCCEPCREEIQCECYVPSYNALHCNCGVFISADFLYWYGRDAHLPYAIVAKTKFANPEQDVSGFIAAPVEFKSLDAAWDPGVRLSLGINSECSGWDYALTWTYYKNTKSSTATVAPFADALPAEGSFSLINPWTNALGQLNTLFLFEQIRAKYEFWIHQLDFEIGWRFWLSKCFTMRPYGAVRTAWTETNFKTKSTHQSYGTDIESALVSTNLNDHFEQCYWGIGFLGGFQPAWYFTPCFSLFGNADIALLWGDFDAQKKERYFIDNQDRDGGPITEIVNYSNTTKLDSYGMQPVLDLALGLRYENTFCDCRYRIALDLGWEHHIWFQHNHRFEYTYYTTAQTLGTETVSDSIVRDTEHSTEFGGFVLRVRYDF